MKAFEFFDHTADIGVCVYGRTPEELFVNAAKAFYEAQGRFAIGEHHVRPVELTAPNTAELLVRWLSELLFLLSAENAYFERFRLQIVDGTTLRGQIEGGPIDYSQSEVFEEIKAITYHQLTLEQTSEGWMARVIFDV